MLKVNKQTYNTNLSASATFIFNQRLLLQFGYLLIYSTVVVIVFKENLYGDMHPNCSNNLWLKINVALADKFVL
jgi:hypothetical protein